jgi:hypothetical protein
MTNIEFDVKVVAPSGNQLPVSCEGQSHKRIRVVPNELGAHRISMQLAGEHLTGEYSNL